MFGSNSASAILPALVLVTSSPRNVLFDPAMNTLKSEVESQLESVYVIQADCHGGRPSLRDALSAACFIGCDSAIVVATQGQSLENFQKTEGVSGLVRIEAVVTCQSATSDAIVMAYSGALAATRAVAELTA